MDVLLRVSEVANALNVSKEAVMQWIEEGRLEAVKLPPTNTKDIYRVKASKLEDFIEAHSTKKEGDRK